MPSIPKKNRDLKRYVFWRDLRRILLYAVWLALWIGGALAYNDNHKTYPDYRRMTGWRLLLWIAIAAVSGFLLFRLWKLFTDRTLCGVIRDTGLSRSYTPSQDPRGSMDYDFRLHTKLKLLDSAGKRKTLRFEQKNGFYTYYYEGARIVRFHGLPYPVRLDADEKSGHVCAACGFWCQKKQPHCELCGLTMIDPDDLRSQ